MKTFNLLLILVLALGVFAFAPQSGVMAVEPGPTVMPDPNGKGTVFCQGTKCESGYDMGDCSAGPCKLMNGYNFINVPAGPYVVHAQTLTSVPRWPAGLVLFPKPVDVYFNPGDTVAFVEVCFPQGNKTGQVFKYSEAGWLPLPTSFYGGMACGTAWGGGIYAYFGYK